MQKIGKRDFFTIDHPLNAEVFILPRNAVRFH